MTWRPGNQAEGSFHHQAKHVLQEEQSDKADNPGRDRRRDPAGDDATKHRPANAGRPLQDRDADRGAVIIGIGKS